MPSESKPLLTAQTEKPNHYKYLKEFRVEQCPSFLQHKCTQHRPFTCFHWHFNNQRRRRPVRKRDGTFNYSADNYCTKYNETSGVCEDGDDCPYLHRTAGDTERRYHLRYYKTCMCVHDTDGRGMCTKNGPHCAFAHGAVDLRPPVLDVRELQALENPDIPDESTNALDRERNLLTEDPKWQDTTYVLSSYKTEQCKRPPRLCRQGYACPQYHNTKDKRRSPRKYKYRSTPCPSVKHGEEWGEPTNCEAGDNCTYCHTRTEQQFHPEIYKSTKCNDVQQAGYCPRGLFCAFAHVEPEELFTRESVLECGTNLAEILTSALPTTDKKNDGIGVIMPVSDNGVQPLPRPLTFSAALAQTNGSGDGSECTSSSSAGSSGGRAPGSHPRPLPPINSFTEPEIKSSWPPRSTSSFDATVLHEVVGKALDDLHLDDPLNLVASLDRELSDSEGLLGGSAPVNIPTRTLSGSPLPAYLRYTQEPDSSEVSRLREALEMSRATAACWDERIAQARTACEAWQRESEESQRAAALAERQRDEALTHVSALRRELETVRAVANHVPRANLRSLPLPALKSLQAQLRAELEEIDKVLYLETATKCMVCEENNRSVTLAPCNHYVLCDTCANIQQECPYCQTPILTNLNRIN